MFEYKSEIKENGDIIKGIFQVNRTKYMPKAKDTLIYSITKTSRKNEFKFYLGFYVFHLELNYDIILNLDEGTWTMTTNHDGEYRRAVNDISLNFKMDDDMKKGLKDNLSFFNEINSDNIDDVMNSVVIPIKTKIYNSIMCIDRIEKCFWEFNIIEILKEKEGEVNSEIDKKDFVNECYEICTELYNKIMFLSKDLNEIDLSFTSREFSYKFDASTLNCEKSNRKTKLNGNFSKSNFSLTCENEKCYSVCIKKEKNSFVIEDDKYTYSCNEKFFKGEKEVRADEDEIETTKEVSSDEQGEKDE